MDRFRGYRVLASEVLSGVVADASAGPEGRAHAVEFLRSRDGRIWCAWLGLDPTATAERLSRRR